MHNDIYILPILIIVSCNLQKVEHVYIINLRYAHHVTIILHLTLIYKYLDTIMCRYSAGVAVVHWVAYSDLDL